VLSPRAIDLLLMFVEQPARLFTKDEIFRLLWPDVAVTDNALTQVVSEIRRALGDSPASARYLQTLARRGYRFVAPVDRVSAGRTTAARPRSSESPPASSRRAIRSIKVAAFLNVSGDRTLAWLATGIGETLTNELRSLCDLRVMDRSGSAVGSRDVDSDFVVVGGFQRVGQTLRFTARVVDVRTREAVAHAQADGDRRSVFALQDALARDLAASLEGALAVSRRGVGARHATPVATRLEVDE
jgi:DNA-binding winged helix-turn-helix (wHTH) protein